VTDYSVKAYGYKIDQVGYYDSTPLLKRDLKFNSSITDKNSNVESTVDPTKIIMKKKEK